ncbi:MAG: DUF4968 domain-containing protein [Chitinispirillaceae bacterium]|nr:DUF4968 domain-containing protein [Chitinispirillaceae bacterium]
MNRKSLFKRVVRRSLCCAALMSGVSYGAAIGTYQSHVQSGNQIDITVSNGKLRIYVCDTNIVRVSFDTRGTFASNQDVLGMEDVNRTWPAVAGLTVTDGTSALDITTPSLRVSVAKNPIRISYYRIGNSTPLTAETGAMNSSGTVVTFTQGADEHFFGWGTAFQWFRVQDNGFYFSLDNKGQRYAKCRETACYMYSTGGYGLFFLFAEPNPSQSQWGPISAGDPGAGFDLTGSTQKYSMSPRMGMDYASYFFIAGDWKTAMTGYTLVSGRPPRLGKKFYGIMRDMYFHSGTSVATMKGWADMFRNNKFNMDWVRMDNFFDWTNLGYLPSVPNPGCWNSEVESAVKYYKDKGFLFGGMSAGWGYYGCCSEGCTQNKLDDVAHCKTAIDHGFDWAWYDAMNYHSRKQAKAQWDTWLEAHGGDETNVFISRGWQALSSQSWPGNHLGDYLNQEWNAYRKFGSFTSAISEALVGYAYSHADLGENYDFGYISFAMRPMYTIHMAGGAGGDAQDFTECGRIGSYPADMKTLMHKWDNLHYRFIPYFFTYGMKAHETGIPVWRGMMCQNGGENDSKTYGLYMQCYVGEELIVSPYFNDCPLDGGGKNGFANNTETRTGDGKRHNIYLPPGVWYDYFPAGAPELRYQGPTTIASYNVNQGNRANMRLPLFVKANSIIPLQEELQFIGEKPEALITVQVWPNDGTGKSPQSGSFTLYEDEKPVKTEFSFTFADDGGRQQTDVTIGPFAGSKYCADAKQRTYRIELYHIKKVSSVKSGGADLPSSAWTWNADNGGSCVINATGDAQTGFTVSAATDAVGVLNHSNTILLKTVEVMKRNGTAVVSVPFTGAHVVEMIDVQGKVVARRAGCSPATYTMDTGRHTLMIYVVRVRAEGQRSIVKRLLL